MDYTVADFLPMHLQNYNKSRIHSYRGARDVAITLNGEVIFKGEIKKAPGNIYRVDACAEVRGMPIFIFLCLIVSIYFNLPPACAAFIFIQFLLVHLVYV